MNWKEIKNDEELEKASSRLDKIFSSRPGDPDYEERKLLVELIWNYEHENVIIPPPDPISAIQFRMEHGGLVEEDLIPYIGSFSDVEKILSGEKLLSKKMVDRLHEGLGIPIKSLISTISTPDYCSAFVRAKKLRAVAEANKIGTDWWVCRVFVAPPAKRGKGFGGAVLERLKDAVRQSGGESLLVTPGGYGEDPEKQFKFYYRHGFKPADRCEDGLLECYLQLGY